MFQDIIAVSLNPSLDVSLWVSKLDSVEPVRASREKIYPGGKAVNVARILTGLGTKCHLLGVTGSANIQRFYSLLNREKICFDFVETSGFIRENISLVLRDGTLYKVDRTGFSLPAETFLKFEKKLNFEIAKSNNPITVFAGSLPQNVTKEQYISLIESAHRFGSLIAIDSAIFKQSEISTIKPFLIKPNLMELGYIAGRNFYNLEDIVSYAKLLTRDVTHVLVSLGENGLLYAGEKGCYYASVPKVEVKSSIAAGDTTLASFLFSLMEGNKLKECVRYAAACGTASVMLDGTAVISKEAADNIYPNIIVYKK